MSADPSATIGAVFPRITRAARWVAAIIGSGVFAACAWMFVLQEGHTGQIFGKTWTESDFPDGLGQAIGAEEPNRAGLVLGLLLGVAIALVYALVERFLPGRGIVKGLTFAAVPFLAWGLLYTPFINSREVLIGDNIRYLETGAFASGAGGGTIVSAIVGSLLVGLILARAYPLMRGAEWWQEHPDTHKPSLAVEDLLELPEKRAE